jgi:hypothetical protein
LTLDSDALLGSTQGWSEYLPRIERSSEFFQPIVLLGTDKVFEFIVISITIRVHSRRDLQCCIWVIAATGHVIVHDLIILLQTPKYVNDVFVLKEFLAIMAPPPSGKEQSMRCRSVMFDLQSLATAGKGCL